MDKKVCKKCGAEKDLIHYPGRRNTCQACLDLTRARTIEKKNEVAHTDALGEQIVDALAAGMTLEEVCAQAGYPSKKQLRRWRRASPEFDAACDEALAQSAAAHLDAAKGVLRKVEDGKLPAPDGRVLFDGHMKLAATLNPARYGTHATVDVTSAGRPLVDLGAAIKALIDVLPTSVGALPAPAPIDIEAIEVPEGATLQ